MPQTTIRKATVADAAQLSGLIRQTIRVSNAKDYDCQSIDLICASFSPERVVERIENEHILLCLSDSQLIGTIGLRGDYLRSLFVEPDHQGRGFGKELVARIEEIARNTGHSTLMVESSITARQFYEFLGFRLVALQQNPEGPTFLMKKTLG